MAPHIYASSLAEAAFPAAAFPFFLPLPEGAAAAFPLLSSSEAAEDAEEAARDLELRREPRVASAAEPESSESSSLW